VASSLKKPKANVFRTFLYLDSDEVVNALSALEGGDVEEVLTHIADEGGSELSGSLGFGPARGGGSKKRTRRLEEEIRRRRTEYSAATALLRILEEQEAIGRIEGSYDRAVHDELEEQMLLEFRARIRIHPVHQMINAGHAWIAASKSFGASQDDIRTVREVVGMFEALSQPATGERKTFLAFAETGPEQGEHRLVLPLQERHLRVAWDDFAGRATFVAQVDRMLRGEDELLALRLIRHAPTLAMEREGVLAALPDLIEAFSTMGISTDISEFVLGAPTVVLKPVCIFK
jgi:hypothetical protein